MISAVLCAALALVGSTRERDFGGDRYTPIPLTGDWGGLRTELRDRGFTLDLRYLAEFMGAFAPAGAEGADYLGHLDLGFTLNFEKLTQTPGLSLRASIIGDHGGVPSNRIGAFQYLSNIEAIPQVRLYELFLQQDLLDGGLSLLAGLYDLNGEFQVSAVSALFVHSSHGIGGALGNSGRNGPSIFPVTGLAVRVRIQAENLGYLMVAAMDAVPGDPEGPSFANFRLSGDEGVLLIAEIGREHSQSDLPEMSAPLMSWNAPVRAGYWKAALGAWQYSGGVPDPRDAEGRVLRPGAYGFYGLVEARLWSEEEAVQGLSAFLRVEGTRALAAPIDAFLGAGLVYRGLFPGRDFDQFGVAVAMGAPAAELPGANRVEHAYELSYRAGLWNGIALKASFQVVGNAGFSREMAGVGSGRLIFRL